MSKKIKDKVTDLWNRRDNNELDKLEVSGRYDNKFERVFNAEEIIDKIEINIDPEKSGLFNKDSVFKKLIENM